MRGPSRCSAVFLGSGAGADQDFDDRARLHHACIISTIQQSTLSEGWRRI